MISEIISQNEETTLKEKKFVEHKLLTNDVIKKLHDTGFNRQADTTKTCGDFLEFRLFQNIQTLQEKEKLSGANFCKFRFCPYCNWRRTRNIAGQIKEALEHINKNDKYSFLFLTLTVKNPNVENLRETVGLMNRSFNKLMKKKEVSKVVKGFFKSLEILGDKTPQGQAHPHFHILLVVDKSYLLNYGKGYISQKEWTRLWKECLNVDYQPLVDIRKIRPKTTKDGQEWKEIDSAVVECVKYAVKHTELVKRSNVDFYYLMVQTMRMRFYSTGGILKEELNLLKAENDLINFKEETDSLWIEICKMLYKFENGNYYLKRIENI